MWINILDVCLQRNCAFKQAQSVSQEVTGNLSEVQKEIPSAVDTAIKSTAHMVLIPYGHPFGSRL